MWVFENREAPENLQIIKCLSKTFSELFVKMPFRESIPAWKKC